MINRWRLPEDRKFLFFYLLAVGCCLALLLWLYLNNEIHDLSNSIQRQKTLLAFMQKADLELRQTTARPQNIGKSAAIPSGSLTTSVQTAINQAQLGPRVVQLRQQENMTLQLSFRQADFDTLISLLSTLSDQNGIEVREARIQKSDKPDIVNADLVLGVAAR